MILKNTIDKETYISKIRSIVGNVTDVTLEGFFDDIKIYEFEDVILSIMSFRDGTGNISVIMIGKRNKEFKDLLATINIKDKFRISGNMEEDIYLVYNKLNNIVGSTVIKKIYLKVKFYSPQQYKS